jgi:hypothetical protein
MVQAHYVFAQDRDGIRESTPVGSALRASFDERVAALLPKRLQSETILGVRRPRREPATDRAARIRTCKSSCDDQWSACRQSCASLAPGTCASCSQVLYRCRDTCETTT